MSMHFVVKIHSSDNDDDKLKQISLVSFCCGKCVGKKMRDGTNSQYESERMWQYLWIVGVCFIPMATTPSNASDTRFLALIMAVSPAGFR